MILKPHTILYCYSSYTLIDKISNGSLLFVYQVMRSLSFYPSLDLVDEQLNWIELRRIDLRQDKQDTILIHEPR